MELASEALNMLLAIFISSIIATISVILRFWCKHKLKAGFHADDWWILICLVSWFGTASATLWGIFNETGEKIFVEIMAQPYSSPSPSDLLTLKNFLVAIYISVTLSYWAAYTAKIAMCLLYRRIFSVPRFRRMSVILMIISTLWIIPTEIVNIINCLPLDSVWRHEQAVICMNFNLIFLTSGIFELVIDVLILALPMWAISTIQMQLKTKLFVATLFLLASFAIITSILRIYYTYQPGARFVNMTGSGFWLAVHIAATILCACVPVYKPLRVLGGVVFNKILSPLNSLAQLTWDHRNHKVERGSTDRDSPGYSLQNTSTNATTDSSLPQEDNSGDSTKELTV
ncbi:hypothetical protein F5Y10DRAFT_269822 [Nemania abortiva]|nr:hypothetical protein F5Y10DRAFT_269822 [Nemania abortiva]